MTSRDHILAVAKRLAAQCPIDKINFTDIAKAAGVSWPTVRRYLGSKKQLRDLLAQGAIASEQPLDTRSRILASASHIFARHGYAGATLDMIAADAGLTKGAVYWHFPSKSDLFLALMEQRMQSRLSVLPEQVEKAFSDEVLPEEGIAELLKNQLNHGQTHPDWVKLHLEFITQSREPEVQKMLSSATYKHLQEMVKSLILHLQDQGKIAADIDPLVLATFWAGMLDGLMLAWLADPQRVDPQSWSKQLARILWRGIGTDEGERGR